MDIAERLSKERRARLAAERLLEQKSRELFAANAKLGLHARSLSDQIVEQREVTRSALTEAENLKGQNSRFVQDLDRAHTTAVMAERRLWDSINTINDGFAVFDADLRLVAANRAFLALCDGLPVAPGITYADLFALAASQGRFEMGGISAADFAADLVARLDDDPIEPVTLQMHNGVWIRLVNRRARDGDMVTLAVDITEQMRIWAAIEAIPDGFVLFDREDRLLICNQRYRDIYAASGPAIQTGAKFEDILRYGLAHDQYPTSDGREEEWLAERLEQHHDHAGPLEQQLGDGRWIRTQDHPTPDGGRVGLRVDITQSKEQEAALLAARLAAEAANQSIAMLLITRVGCRREKTGGHGHLAQVDVIAFSDRDAFDRDVRQGQGREADAGDGDRLLESRRYGFFNLRNVIVERDEKWQCQRNGQQQCECDQRSFEPFHVVSV